MKNEKKPEPKPEVIIPPIRGGINGIGLIQTDPLGSYTGNPDGGQKEPVQDADDL